MRRLLPLMPALPALLAVGVVFAGGIGLGLLRTAGIQPFATSSVSLDAYARAVAEPGLAASIGATLAIAVVATVLSTAFGVAAALLIRAALRRLRRGRALVVAFQLMLAVPHAVVAIGVALLIGQSGLIARLAAGAGLIDRPAEFPVLTADPLGLGILIAYGLKEVPFVGLVVLSQLVAIGDGPEQVARSLGATRLQAFRHVLLPMIAPTLLAAAAVIFAFAIGSYDIPSLLGASHPKLLPVLAYEMFTSSHLEDRPAAIVLALATALTAGLLFAGAARLLRPSGAR